MLSMQGVGNNLYRINFRADSGNMKQQTDTVRPQNPPMISPEEFRKERKKQNRKSNAIAWISVCTMIVLAGTALYSIFGKGGLNSLRSKTEQDALNLKAIDLKTIKKRPYDSYSKEVQEFVDDFDSLLRRKDIEDKGGKRIAQVQLQGPGGTGKTDVAGVLAKKVDEVFPGSEYYIPDLSTLTSSSWKGQDVQMLTEYTKDICKRADALAKETKKTGQKKYLVCFLDEFDKIAMENHGVNKADSNKTVGALKTLINGLMERDNVILISATNYPELIEDAVSSRVAEKVMVDYLTPKQTITTIVDHYSSNAKKMDYISKELMDVNNPKLKEICEIISDKSKGHEMEFRKLYNNILPKTLLKSPECQTIEIKHLVDAITTPSVARELRLTESEIHQLKRIAA